MEYPENLKYTKEHEWVRVDGDVGVVGVTQHAQEALGDVVFVELPEPGTRVGQNEQFGTVESVKAVSDLLAPVSGKILKANDELIDAPELVNEDCMGQAWMIEIEMSNPADAEGLLSADDYTKLVAESS